MFTDNDIGFGGDIAFIADNYGLKKVSMGHKVAYQTKASQQFPTIPVTNNKSSECQRYSWTLKSFKPNGIQDDILLGSKKQEECIY